MADVFFKDEDVEIKDTTDVEFDDHYLFTLTVSDCANVQTAEAPVLLQEQTLAINDGTQENVSDVLDLGATLVIEDCAQENVTDEISLGPSLLVDSCTQQNVTTALVLSQESTLSISSTYHVNAVADLTVTPIIVDGEIVFDGWLDTSDSKFEDEVDTEFYPHILTDIASINDGTQINVADTVVLTGEGTLAVSNTYHAQPAGAVLLSQEQRLVVDSAAQVNVGDGSTILVQYYTPTVDSAAQVNVAESATLEQEYVLSLSDTAQINVADALSINVSGDEEISLALSDAVNINTADAPVLIQEHELSANDAVQANVADELNISGTFVLSLESAENLQSSEAIVIAQRHVLVVSDSDQIGVADGAAALTQTQRISIEDAVDEQYADAPVVSELPFDSLTLEDAAQVNVTEALVLIQEYILENSDCAQLNATEPLELVISSLLGVSNATQAQFAESMNIFITLGIGDIVNPYLISITKSRVIESVTTIRYLMQ